jgi:hypothetical protein
MVQNFPVDEFAKLVKYAVMKLRKYLDDHAITAADFALRIGVSVQSVHRYLHDERVPKLDVMAKIKEHTGGAVQPNDFFDRAAA